MMKTILFVIAFISMANAAQSAVLSGTPRQNQHNNDALIGKPFEAVADSIAPDSTGMDTSTSVEFAPKMVPGWNVSNTLEAIPTETSWGSPLTAQRLMDSVRAAGFHSVRIPVSWSSHFTDTSTYTIDTTWLKRVEQVVNYVLKDSMYAVVNEHWDGGWQQPTYADSAYVNHRLSVMWKQIAIHFRDYGDHLLFAGMNEVGNTNYSGTPTKEFFAVQNSFAQTFVNTVRSTGGRNYYRYLLVQGYFTNIDYTVNNFKVPTDLIPNRLIVEDHYYDPYDFTLNSNSSIIEWGMYAKDPSKTETWANEAWADGQFQKMKTTFIDHGYGVVIGEYGAMARNLGNATLNAIYSAYRKYYMQYITRSIERHGLVPMYWDGGLFNRSTGAHEAPDIIDAIVDTSKVRAIVGIQQPPSTPTKFFLGQNYPNPFNPVTTIDYQVPTFGDVRIRVYDILGREVTTLVNDMKEPGKYEVKFDATDLPTGVYFYRLQAGIFTETKKVTVLK